MPEKLSVPAAVAAAIASTFGTGILFMPCGFRLLGYGNAIAALAVIGCTTFYTLYSLAYAALLTNATSQASYSSLALVFSPHLKRLVDIMLAGRTMGTSLAMTRYFSSSAALLLAETGIPLSVEAIRKTCLCLFVAAVGYFLTKSRITSLSFIPKISLAGVLCYIAVTAYYALAYGQPLSKLRPMSNHYSRGFIKCIFALHCQSGFLSIFNEMESQSLHSVGAVAAVASGSLAAIYAASGFLGYKAAGDEIGDRHMLELLRDRRHPLMQRIAAESFDRIGALPIIINACFLFVWFGFVVFAYFPLVAVVQGKLLERGLKTPRHVVALAIAAYLLLGSLPRSLQISGLLDVSAALFTNPLGFVCPSIFMIRVAKRYSIKSMLGFVLVLLSLSVSAGVVYSVVAHSVALPSKQQCSVLY